MNRKDRDLPTDIFSIDFEWLPFTHIVLLLSCHLYGPGPSIFN